MNGLLQRIFLVAACWSWGTPASAATFAVDAPQLRTEDGVVLLDAQVHVVLPHAVVEALESGVPLTFEITARVERPREWWLPDETLASVTLRRQLRYHALSQSFQVADLERRTHRSYTELGSALDALGLIPGLPLIETQYRPPAQPLTVSLRMALDREALPLPLQPRAWITGVWDLSSDWHEWTLPP